MISRMTCTLSWSEWILASAQSSISNVAIDWYSEVAANVCTVLTTNFTQIFVMICELNQRSARVRGLELANQLLSLLEAVDHGNHFIPLPFIFLMLCSPLVGEIDYELLISFDLFSLLLVLGSLVAELLLSRRHLTLIVGLGHECVFLGPLNACKLLSAVSLTFPVGFSGRRVLIS